MKKYDKFNSFFKGNLKPIVFLFTLFMLIGCNEDFPNLLKEEYPKDYGIDAPKNSKVLVIIVDGLQGNIVKGLAYEEIPVISKMTENAVYSFNSLVDYGTTGINDALGWTTLMTGVTSQKHGVLKATDFSVANFETYPTFISRIKKIKPNLKSVVLGTSADFVDIMSVDAHEKESFSSDGETKAAVIKALGNDENDIIVAQFSDVSKANKGVNEDYVRSIEQFDKELGELKSALEARPHYKLENWMVIVTSNKGMDGEFAIADKFDDVTRNTFTLIYSPKFSSRIAAKSLGGILYSGNAMRYEYGSEKNTATLVNVNDYNFGSFPNYTVQLTIKTEGAIGFSNYSYPTILSKRTTAFSGPGWNLFLYDGTWWLNSSIADQVRGGVVSDGKWHTITVVFDGGRNKVIGYTDGVLDVELPMKSGSLDNDAPLQIGQLDNSVSIDYLNMVNIQVFDQVLSKKVISAYAHRTSIDNLHPNWDNLLGYWPGDDVGQATLKEKTGKGHDFQLNGDLKWESIDDFAQNPAYYTSVPNSVDFAFQIYQWLGIPVLPAWNLDGKVWIPPYTQIRP